MKMIGINQKKAFEEKFPGTIWEEVMGYLQQEFTPECIFSDDALDEVFQKGREAGIDQGHEEGYEHGFGEGHEEGFKKGYEEGFAAAEEARV